MTSEANPFVLYRTRLDSYSRWIASGGNDNGFVGLVERLDSAITGVEATSGRTGFRVTPTALFPDLAQAAGLDPSVSLWVKDETNNVSGSHKARHLFGLAIHLAIDELASSGDGAELAVDGLASSGDGAELVIASCGNAALGAAVVAKAADRALRVFIPMWADEEVVSQLEVLGATIERCERRPDEVGDPCYLRFKEAISEGSIGFSVQGSDVPRTLDGGRTIGWELADSLAAAQDGRGRLDRVFVQVGGGALGACLAAGLADGVAAGSLESMPRVYGVQTDSVAPLRRAWDAAGAAGVDRSKASELSDEFMWPWEDVGTSAASGILDDVTYDWVPLTAAMAGSGGEPLVVSELAISEALDLGRRHTGIDVDATGTAGLAGLMSLANNIGAGEHVALLFTGHRRS